MKPIAVRLLLREPLVHFLLAGFAVFLFWAWRGDSPDPASRTITITAEQVQRLAERWSQTWQRAPSQVEIDGLIRDYIKEEVYTREAKQLGLDVDDAVIRRRLRSKMEFLAGAQVENATPDEATLQAWLNKNPQKYAADAAYSFDQIYLKSDGEVVPRERAQAALKQLSTGADWRALGDPISLPRSLEAAPKNEVAREFGDAFAATLAAQKPGGWVGPIASGFGAHLVRLRRVKTSVTPTLDQARQAVENDWRATTLKLREDKAYQALLDGYRIKIAKP